MIGISHFDSFRCPRMLRRYYLGLIVSLIFQLIYAPPQIRKKQSTTSIAEPIVVTVLEPKNLTSDLKTVTKSGVFKSTDYVLHFSTANSKMLSPKQNPTTKNFGTTHDDRSLTTSTTLEDAAKTPDIVDFSLMTIEHSDKSTTKLSVNSTTPTAKPHSQTTTLSGSSKKFTGTTKPTSKSEKTSETSKTMEFTSSTYHSQKPEGSQSTNVSVAAQLNSTISTFTAEEPQQIKLQINGVVVCEAKNEGRLDQTAQISVLGKNVSYSLHQTDKYGYFKFMATVSDNQLLEHNRLVLHVKGGVCAGIKYERKFYVNLEGQRISYPMGAILLSE
ncbi:hypothetical protein M3Y96_01227000 [Aphelenchoides besseyi]|nr:hypothetical protein M3Y96_01227000 [Aphelenchoides besseyi]